MGEPAIDERLRSLPSVEEVVGADDLGPHRLAVAATREAIGALRVRIAAGEAVVPSVESIREEARARVAAARRPSQRLVLNAAAPAPPTHLRQAPPAASTAAPVGS